MKANTVYEGDCLDVMRQFPDNCIDTILTDPPYGLSFMGKDWDHGLPGIAYWRECLRVAKPGAMLMAFGGTRTYHRLVCAIEDAGWQIRDCISYFHDGNQAEQAFMASLNEEQLAAYLELHYPNMQMSWVYGQGIGLEYDVGKGIDRANGAERDVVGRYIRPDGSNPRNNCITPKFNGKYNNGNPGLDANDGYLTAPATPLAAKFDGYNTRLKPAHEPIVIAMKPVERNYAHNAEKWGLSGMWIDGARISTQDDAILLPNNQEPLISGDAFSCIHSFLRDFYDHILSSAHCYNIDGTSLKRNVVDLGDKLPAAFLCEPCLNRHSANDGVRDQNLSSIQDFQSDCLIYRHFCDELSRLFLEDDLNIRTLQNDALKCIHPSLSLDDLDEVSYDTLYHLCIDHLSSCDDVHVFLSRLHSLLKSISNYTTLPTNPQGIDFVPNFRNKVYGKGLGGKNPNGYPKGRYPANVIHSGEPGVMAEFDKAGVRKNSPRGMPSNDLPCTGWGGYHSSIHYEDNNTSAARFFAHYPPDEPSRFIYCPKASPKERATPGNNHPTQKPLSLIRYLAKLTRPPDGGIVLDPFAGSGTTALACISEGRDYILIEKESEYAELCRRRIAEYTGQKIAEKEIELSEEERARQLALW